MEIIKNFEMNLIKYILSILIDSLRILISNENDKFRLHNILIWLFHKGGPWDRDPAALWNRDPAPWVRAFFEKKNQMGAWHTHGLNVDNGSYNWHILWF